MVPELTCGGDVSVSCPSLVRQRRLWVKPPPDTSRHRAVASLLDVPENFIMRALQSKRNELTSPGPLGGAARLPPNWGQCVVPVAPNYDKVSGFATSMGPYRAPESFLRLI